MAIDLNALPATWVPIWRNRESKTVCTNKELGPIFRLLHLAGVHERDVDLLLDHEDKKMLRINIFKRKTVDGDLYDHLMYGPLIFRDGKVFSFTSVIHERSISSGNKLVNPHREMTTLDVDKLAIKIKGDIAKILDSRKLRALPSD